MKNYSNEIMVKFAKDMGILDPREDPNDPRFEEQHEKDKDEFKQFEKSLPKRKGFQISVCPDCDIDFKIEEKEISPLTEWAFKDDIDVAFTTKGCPNCDPNKYDKSKDPSVMGEMGKLEQKKIQKDFDFGDVNIESTPLEDIEFANDGSIKTSSRKILSKWAEDFEK